MGARRAIDEERRGGIKEGAKNGVRFGRKRDFIKRRGHELEPTISGRFADGKWRVTHAQAWMSPLFDILLRAAKTIDQEISQALFGAFPIAGGIEGTEDVVVRDLPVKRRNQALEAFCANLAVDLILLHSADASIRPSGVIAG